MGSVYRGLSPSGRVPRGHDGEVQGSSRRNGRFHDFGTFRLGETVVSSILLMFPHMGFSSRRNGRFHIIERFVEAIWPFPACRLCSDDCTSRRGETVVFTTLVRFIEAIWPFPAGRSYSGICASRRGGTVVFCNLERFVKA